MMDDLDRLSEMLHNFILECERCGVPSVVLAGSLISIGLDIARETLSPDESDFMIRRLLDFHMGSHDSDTVH